MRRSTFAALSLVALASRPARADGPAVVTKPASFALDATTLRMTVAYRDVINAKIQGNLKSGLPTVFVMRGALFEDGVDEPVATVFKTCRIAYDPWDEIFRIETQQSGTPKQALPITTLEGAIRRCTETRATETVPALAIVELGRLKVGARYFVQALVEVNPVSPEMLERIKRWMTRPAGVASAGAGDALFGSFVGLFVARVGNADNAVAFKTQAFVAPTSPP